MAKQNIIKKDSILSNLFDQKTGKLISVLILRTRDLCKEFRMMFKQNLPNGTCIQCIYVGENHLTFMEIKRYGSAAWRVLESKIGQTFEVEQEPDSKQETLVFQLTEPTTPVDQIEFSETEPEKVLVLKFDDPRLLKELKEIDQEVTK